MLYEFDFLPIFAGAERGSRISQLDFTQFYEWVRATQGALSDPNDVLERCHCLAVIGERGGVVFVEVEGELQLSRAALRARETPSTSA